MQSVLDTPRSDSPVLSVSSPVEDNSNLGDEEQGLAQHVALHFRTGTSNSEETELRTRPNSIASTGAYIKQKTSQIFDAVTSGSSRSTNTPLTPKLAALVDAYAQSAIAADLRTEMEEIRASANGADTNGNNINNNNHNGELPDVAAETTLLRGRKRASWGTQFRILSGRAFKNLYRDPALLTAHYTSSIALACRSHVFILSAVLT